MSQFNITHSETKHNPFVVPEGYFENFTQRLMERIPVAVEASPRTLRFVRFVPWLGAACVAGLMFFFAHFPTSTTTNDLAGINETEQKETNNTDAVYDYLMMADATNIAIYETDY